MILLIVDDLIIRSSTICSKTNSAGAIAPACGIGVLLNLSISRGLMPTLFRRTIHGEYTERTDNIATYSTQVLWRRDVNVELKVLYEIQSEA